MEDRLRMLEEAYDFYFNDDKNCKDEMVNELIYMMSYYDFYLNVVSNYNYKSINNEEVNEIFELQKRILDGFKYGISILIEEVDDNNFNQISDMLLNIDRYGYEKFRKYILEINKQATINSSYKKNHLVCVQVGFVFCILMVFFSVYYLGVYMIFGVFCFCYLVFRLHLKCVFILLLIK